MRPALIHTIPEISRSGFAHCNSRNFWPRGIQGTSTIEAVAPICILYMAAIGTHDDRQSTFFHHDYHSKDKNHKICKNKWYANALIQQSVEQGSVCGFRVMNMYYLYEGRGSNLRVLEGTMNRTDVGLGRKDNTEHGPHNYRNPTT